MDDAQLAAVVDANYSESFSIIARMCGGDVWERDEVLCIATGLPVASLNHGLIKKPPADPERSVRDMVAFFERAGLPFILRVREGVAPAAEAAVKAAGLRYLNTEPGMALHPIGVAPPPPEGLVIQTVRDEQMLETYQEVMADGFSMPLEFAQSLIPSAALQVPGLESYLGTVDGKGVATTSLYAANATAGVYNVTTIESHRRRGIGAALTWHAVTRGRDQGCAVATLTASAMGKPVYERIGFRTVAPYREFTRPQ
jgi:GNAT superfamily N-acetyltransferase